jgi:hypothetical protein
MGRRLPLTCSGFAVLLLVMAGTLSACSRGDPPIRVTRDALIVENQTREEWRDITVTVNGYYRGTSKTLAPGGRLDANLGNFVTGLGQRFDKNRERVTRVEVRATEASGRSVTLDWPAGK